MMLNLVLTLLYLRHRWCPDDQIRCSAQLVENGGAASDPLDAMISIENRLPGIQDVLVYAPSGDSVELHY